MTEYHYRLKERPPAPGALPRDGLMRAYSNDMWANGKHYWGKAVYNRKLTDEECNHYDMELFRTEKGGE